MCRNTSARSRRFAKSAPTLVQNLESRLLLSTYTPAQIRSAYGFNSLTANGAGQTIAIVDAYNDSHITTDLNTFDQTLSANGGPSLYNQYGDAASFLTVASLGAPGNADWAMETSLDVEWAHAIAPAAKIVLVEARSDSLSDLLTAVNYARKLSTVSVVSMSWGGGEFSSEASYDSYFTTPAGHKGITFVASSGDSGAGASWPAIASNVLSVGGTSLTLTNSGYFSESAWSGSGGGVSRYEKKPSYQNAVNSSAYRTNPDVAYNADPSTGFYVYDSNYDGQSGWWNIGGTSAGAPQWAALIALADQTGGVSLTTAQTLDAIYSLPASDFHDITAGYNGYFAHTGYDLLTGRGSPIANLIVPALATSTRTFAQTSKTPTHISHAVAKAQAHPIFTLNSFISASPTPLALTTPIVIAPLSVASITAPMALIATPVTFAAFHPAELPVTTETQARLADLIYPSTDEILPAATPDGTPNGDTGPTDSPAPAPFANQLEDPIPDGIEQFIV
jgi:subtilase family serine protease